MLLLLSLSNLEKNSQFPNVGLGKKLPDSKTGRIVIVYSLTELLLGAKRGDAKDFKH